MLKRFGKVTAAAGVVVLMSATGAYAHSTPYVEDGAYDNAKATHGHDLQQHGGDEGHLPPVQEGKLDLKSKTRLSNVVEGKIADVGVLGTTAYLAAWGGQTCDKNGVHVVDIADVANPVEIGFIKSKEGSYSGEGVQALPITTSAFSGDILVTNNEQCKRGVGFGGINIYDVTNPAAPTPLSVGFGDDSGQPGQGKKAAHETHSVFAWDAGDKAYAVMVDNAEAKDIDIVDITNPMKPTLIAEYDLATYKDSAGNSISLQDGLPEIFLHDMVVKKIDGKQVMLASYWDGGYVTLDVTDPTKALVMADSDFADPDPQGKEGTAPADNYEDGVQGKPLMVQGAPVPPEGNAHQAEFAGGDNFVLGADEDFSPYALVGTADGTDELTAGQGSGTTPLEPGQTLTGDAVFFGQGCTADPKPGAGDGTQIAVVERGVCTFTEKVASVEAVGGYAAVLIYNRTGSDACDGSLGMSVEGKIPAFGVAPRGQGFAIFDQAYDNDACLGGTGASSQPLSVALGTVGDSLSFSSYFDGWGYVRLLNTSDMTEVDTYAIPEAHDPAFATGSGDLSVHEVATSAKNSNLAYVSYYAGGVRVIDITTGKIVEQAAFIDEGGSNFWGVETFTGADGKEYVAASDRDLGLYIFEYTPVNTP